MRNLKLLLAFLVFLSYSGSNLFAADCLSVITDYINWLKTPSTEGGYTKAMSYKIITNKIKPSTPHDDNFGFLSSSESWMSLNNGGLYGQGDQLFSDRMAKTTTGGFSIPVQPYDYTKKDILGLGLKANGTGFVKLVTWGGGTLNIQSMTCTPNAWGTFITGFVQESNGISSIAISLHKTYNVVIH